ncbi:MAG: WecB/TagA/CpsF family glycosyltransferase [Ignavibacteriaceae bacterium]
MIKVLGTKLFADGLDSAVDRVIKLSLEKGINENYCISATGAHGLVTAKRSAKFREILDQFYMNLPDGMPGVWIGKLKGANQITRCYGPDFFKLTILESANKNIKHFFCGGKQGVAEDLKSFCLKNLKNNNIVGTYSPPFRKMNDAELKNLGDTINRLNTDIVWIGLSTPKQEEFALELKKYTKVKFIITVGAAFDFHTGRIKQAPHFLQKLGLEWFFRLCTEPKRLYKRYLEIVPLFILFNIVELFQFIFNKSMWRKKYA